VPQNSLRAPSARYACMVEALGWRDSIRNRPLQRTDSFEISPAPPSNVD
jgi:hypothetical protein